MEKSYWESRWKKGKIGFHAVVTDDALFMYWDLLPVRAGSRVFVPLCGKSLDMIWLAGKGHKVIGVEIVEQACEEFFEEHGFEPKKSESHGFTVYTYGPFEIWCGDMFKLPEQVTRKCDSVYDRASLVALPEDTRRDYTKFMMDRFPDKPHLLVSFEYDQSRMGGPPFSVPVSEIQDLYGKTYQIETLQKEEEIQNLKKFQDKGLSSMLKIVCKLAPE